MSSIDRLAGSALLLVTAFASGCSSTSNGVPADGSDSGSNADTAVAMGSDSGTMETSTDSGGGAQGVLCGATPCGPPMTCCQAAPGGAVDAGASTPTCVVACTAEQEQLCSSDNDCQQSGTAICVQGVCTDPGAGGGTDAGNAPDSNGGGVADAGEDASGGAPPPPMNGDGGVVPAGYPTPTAATFAKCNTVPMTGAICPGGGAGPVCIECLFGGSTYTVPNVATAQGIAEAGNYLVTVELGGAAAGQTFISAEANRGLLSPLATTAGESVEYAFVVNVRALEGQPQEATGSAGYPGLDMFFSGPTATPPKVSAIGYDLATTATKPIMVYIASDSTACDQTNPAYAGWGQMLPEFFAPPIGIANYADSGESSASFMGATKWGAGGITSHWSPGDYVLIQFGTNDKGVSDATVQANLEIYVTQAKAAKVTPILISPPARVQFVGNVEGDQSSLHAASAQAAALAENVAYIDLTALSTAWYNSLGSQAASLKFHANDSDATHTNFAGATMLASIVANAMKTQKLPLAQYLR